MKLDRITLDRLGCGVIGSQLHSVVQVEWPRYLVVMVAFVEVHKQADVGRVASRSARFLR